MRSKLYFLAAFLAIAAAATHALAIRYSLYWSFSWFDFPVHVLASGMVGIISYLVVSSLLSHRFAPYAAIILLACVGVSWEVFEYLTGAAIVEPGFMLDTLIDAGANLLGGLSGIYLAHRTLDASRFS
jgi:hypothetical protein